MFYIAHRLFAAHDRHLAAEVAERLAMKVGERSVFLPFCDTDEEELVAEEKGRRLYELDRERLHRTKAMLALLHGPSLDDGVCMEIGYARALGVPVVVLSTDFQSYSLTADGPRLIFPDPLIQVAVTAVVSEPRLAIAQSGESSYGRFQCRNRTQIDRARDTAIDRLLACPASAGVRIPLSQQGRRNAVFVEPSPYSAAAGCDQLVRAVRSARQDAILASRWTSSTPVVDAWDDLVDASTATALITDVSGPETPPGAAILIGAAHARGTPIAAFQPTAAFTHAPGREPNRRNLMVHYAVDTWLSEPADVAQWLAG